MVVLLLRCLSMLVVYLMIVLFVVIFLSEFIGVRCSIFWNFVEVGVLMCWVGELGVMSLGCFFLSATSSSYVWSYVVSSTEGLLSMWYSCS